MRESPGRIEFVTLLVGGGRGGAAVTLPVPREVSAALGSQGRVEVKGTVNGRPLRAPAMPDGKGGHTILLSGDPFAAGERVKVVLEREVQEAQVDAPPDLAKALAHHVQARAAWDRFPPSQRQGWIDSLAQARKPDLREQRIREAVQRIALGKKA